MAEPVQIVGTDYWLFAMKRGDRATPLLSGLR
jgi:hypothetical protein